jgi:ABC-type branched-subunit amino acid transport system substrate-binding protein
MVVRRRSTAVRGLALLLGCALVAACGARVSDQQVRALRSAPAASGAATPAAGGAETTTTVGTASGPSAAAGPSTAGNAAGPTATVAAGTKLTASDTGITPDSITLGHVTQLSGPVPGLFAGSVRGMTAYQAYANSRGGLIGRKLQVETRDDQFDAAQNRVVTNDLLGKTFALIGGVSLYDDASAGDVGKSGAPDIPGLTLNKVRGDLPNNFAIAPNADGAPTSHFLWFQRQFPDAVKNVGSLYGDVPSAKRAHENQRRAAESIGYVWKYDRGYQPTETDFTADVIRMRQSGVKAVFLVALDAKNVARVLNAAHQQNWKPDVWILGASAYDRALLTLAGPSAEGVTIFSTVALYAGEDSAAIPEVKLFNDWFQKTNPGKTPDFYAVSAWMANMLLAQALQKAGPNPTRASVVAALHSITSFDGNGMQAEVDPAAKRPSTCYLIAKVEGGKYKRVEPLDKGFRCEGTYLRR